MYQSLPHSQSVFSIETANLVEPLFNFALKSGVLAEDKLLSISGTHETNFGGKQSIDFLQVVSIGSHSSILVNT